MRISDWISDVCSSDLDHTLLASSLKPIYQGGDDPPQRLQTCIWHRPQHASTYRARAFDLESRAPRFDADVAITKSGLIQHGRSEERRVGTECVRTCRSRW